MIADLTTLLRDAAYLAFEDGTNDYTTAPKAADALEAQAARIAELEAALQFANEYVGRLASTLAKKHYPDQQRFELLPDLLGRIDQIDNMTCGLHRAALGGKDE